MTVLRKLVRRFLGGHVTVGPVTLYGDNAMAWTAQVRTATGYLVARAPIRRPWKIYFSPNATPWAATWGMGPGFREHGDDLPSVRRHLARSREHVGLADARARRAEAKAEALASRMDGFAIMHDVERDKVDVAIVDALLTSRAVDVLGLREQVRRHLENIGAIPYVVEADGPRE